MFTYFLLTDLLKESLAYKKLYNFLKLVFKISYLQFIRKVMEKTEHTLLVGEWATKFAIQMGFQEETLSTPESEDIWEEWQDRNCQPNFWKVWID